MSVFDEINKVWAKPFISKKGYQLSLIELQRPLFQY